VPRPIRLQSPGDRLATLHLTRTVTYEHIAHHGFYRGAAGGRIQAAVDAITGVHVSGIDRLKTFAEGRQQLPASALSGPASVSWHRTMLRLWALREITAVPAGSPAVVILLMALVWVAAWIGIDWWERQPAPVFFPDGIPVLGWYGLAVIALAQLVRRGTPRPPAGACIALATGVVPLPLLLVTVGAAWLTPVWFWCAAGAVAFYLMVYLARGLHAFCGRPRRMAALLGVGFVGLFAVLSDVTNAIPDVWNPQDAPATVSDADVADRETALFEQSGRIDEALESVRRDASPPAQSFFLGFAGVGDEKVFAQEIGLASRVIGERYKTADRQISLVNDERDLDAAPLASVTGLTYALEGLAEHMHLDQDVLFLAISSHGSSDPAIAVENSGLPLTDLTPEDLVAALNDAGIQWRVILISACYAGGFIAPLRDPHTIVITAAAADRTSFGCSSDSDLTYFGEAFYRDALPDATSLRDAFETAKAAIALREHAEGETPSDPQAYFGFDLEAHLAAGGRLTAAKRPAFRRGTQSGRPDLSTQHCAATGPLERHPSRPKPPRAESSRGRPAGNGTGEMATFVIPMSWSGD
jgi:hypothetical protein